MHYLCGVKKKINIAIFASGSGSNAGCLVKHFKNHDQISVAAIVTNNPNAFVLERAKNNGIESRKFKNEDFITGESVLNYLLEKEINFIVLAGFLRKIPDTLIQQFKDKIINIHPALLPKFGGKGMYGVHVHEAVKQAGEKLTGITIHVVDSVFDNGKHIAQYTCHIDEYDTVETIAQKVQVLEHRYFAPTVEKYILC